MVSLETALQHGEFRMAAAGFLTLLRHDMRSGISPRTAFSIALHECVADRSGLYMCLSTAQDLYMDEFRLVRAA